MPITCPAHAKNWWETVLLSPDPQTSVSFDPKKKKIPERGSCCTPLIQYFCFFLCAWSCKCLLLLLFVCFFNSAFPDMLLVLWVIGQYCANRFAVLQASLVYSPPVWMLALLIWWRGYRKWKRERQQTSTATVPDIMWFLRGETETREGPERARTQDSTKQEPSWHLLLHVVKGDKRREERQGKKAISKVHNRKHTC